VMYKIKLSMKARAEFTALRAALVKALAAGAKKSGAHAALEKEVAALGRQIERLEGSADLTDAVANAIAFKREKLRLLQKRLDAAENPAGEERDMLSRILIQFRQPFHAAMSQVHDVLAGQILEALRPFYLDDSLGSHLYSPTDAMKSLGNFTSRQWGMIQESTFSQARDAIQIIDTFLAGKSPWQLD
jgi:hypothetical protein